MKNERVVAKNFILTTIIILSQTACADLVSYWKFDETSGNIAYDSSGNGNHGKLINETEWKKGRINNALDLNEGGYVDCCNTSSVILQKDFTISLWFYARDWGNKERKYPALISKRDDYTTMEWQLFYNSEAIGRRCAGIQFWYGKKGRYKLFVDLEVKPTLNIWHQIAVTRAGQTWTLYLDGICQSTQYNSGLIPVGSGNINIGILGQDGEDSYFNGLIDDVYIFDQALEENRIYQLYLKGNEVGLEKFSNVSEKAETMLKEQKSQEAITYLEKQISEYEKWKEQAPNAIGLKYEPLYCDLYFLLGKAEKAAGISQADVVDAFSKTFNSSRFDYVPEQTAALIWLLENGFTNKYNKTIKLLTQGEEIEKVYAKIIRKVCEHFESKNDWSIFERFLDSLFTSAKNPDSWSLFLETCLSDKTSLWAKKYFSYIDKMPRLNIERKWISTQKYMAEENFEKAAEVCRDILNSCGPEDDKARFEFWLYVCIFEQGKYKEVIPFFESFAVNHKATHRVLARRATLVKGQAHIQLGELDKAIETFLGLMVEYPQTSEISEANFFIGYCYMLQKKYETAQKAFNCVIEGFPESLYAGKARLCLIRIEDLIKQEKG